MLYADCDWLGKTLGEFNPVDATDQLQVWRKQELAIDAGFDIHLFWYLRRIWTQGVVWDVDGKAMSLPCEIKWCTRYNIYLSF